MGSTRPPPTPPLTIRKVRDRAAATDVGAEEHWICVDPALTDQPIRRFGAFTEDLIAAVGWCVELGVTSMAMEATGIYWRELFSRLEEAGIEVMLVDPRRTRNPRGRKTDMQDCRWIWELHAHGLLDGAYVPPPEVQELRTYLRFRKTRIERASMALKEVQRALSMMNLKLQHVIADVGGATGQAIIAAILGGERNPRTLATLRNYRCTASEETLVKSLTGTWRTEHLFLLAQAHADYLQQLQAIVACDQELDRLIAKLPQRSHDDGSDLPPKRPTGKHDFGFDAQRASYRITGVDLASIDGIGPNTALSFLGEVGFDLSAWPTAKAFCCWLGLCPNPKRSGGTNHGNLPTTANRAAQMLKDAAMGLRGAKQNPLARYYAKLAVRRGSAQALKAVAHKLARIIYALFKSGSAYDRTKLVPPANERTAKRMIQRLAAEAGRLGYSLQKTLVQSFEQKGTASC